MPTLGDRYLTYHPPAIPLQSGQLIDPLVMGASVKDFLGTIFRSLNIIPEGRSFSHPSSFFYIWAIGLTKSRLMISDGWMLTQCGTIRAPGYRSPGSTVV
jgi:hypothetical protein